MEYSCPGRTLLAVEHPGNVISIDRGIASIGGPEALRKVADDPTASSLELRFRPSDRFEHPVISKTVSTNNMLIKLIRRQNEDGSLISDHEPLAMIRNTLRFRDMADFQWNTSKSDFLHRFERAVNAKDAKTMSEFSLDRESALTPDDLDIMPPPVFSNTVVPHSYNYQQNPAAKKVDTENGPKLVNRTRAVRLHIFSRVPEDPDVPSQASAKLDETPTDDVASLIAELRRLFQERPLWTRRGLINSLPAKMNEYDLKFALPYVAYKWKKGPWRDCYASFGVDPRSDASYAKFQAIYCTNKRTEKDWTTPAHETPNQTHIFDGQTLWLQGRTFMFIDMTDPLLEQIKATAILRDSCHPKHGWWRVRTIEAVRHILRTKLASLCTGTIPSDLEFSSTLAKANDPDDEKVEEADQDDMLHPEEDEQQQAEEEDAMEQEDDVEIEANSKDNVIDPSLLAEDLDVRVRDLMGKLVKPSEDFDAQRDGSGGVRSDFDGDDIYGADSSD